MTSPARISVLAMMSLLFACGPMPHPTLAPVEEQTTSRLLGFVKDGRTMRGEAMLRLGLPAERYEADRILVFGISESAGRAQVVVAPGGDGRSYGGQPLYHLVLVFDEAGLLERHGLVQVR